MGSTGNRKGKVSGSTVAPDGGMIGNGSANEFVDLLGRRVPMYEGNPFWRRSRPLRMATILKLVFGVVVVPLRVILCSILVFSATGVCFLIFLGAPKLSMYEPLPKERRVLTQRLLQLGCRWVLFVLGAFHIDEELVDDVGEPGENGSFVLVSNHVSFLDIFYLLWRFSPSFVSKAEVRSIPGIGSLAKCIRCIFVDRTDGNTPSASQQIKARLEIPGFPPTLVFPEATTSNNEAILPFRTGAFVPGAPVKIVLFTYTVYDFDPSYCGLGPLVVYSMLSEPVLSMRVRSLPLYHPSEEERKDPHLYAQKVRLLMQEHLGLPLTNLSFTDRNDRRLSREFVDIKKLL